MARRRISDPGQQELPQLSEREQVFVRLLAEGRSQADAYRIAYPSETRSDNATYVGACKTAAKPAIRLWLAHATAQAASRLAYTREKHLARLEELSIRAEASGNYGAAVQAEQLRGKAAGYYQQAGAQAVEIVDPAAQLDEIARTLGVDLAARLAAREGIVWQPPDDLVQPAGTA